MSQRLIRIAVLALLGVLLVSLPLLGCDNEEKITITAEQLREGIPTAVDFETWHYKLKDWSKANLDADDAKHVTTKLDETDIVVDKSNKKVHGTKNEEMEFRDLIKEEESYSQQEQGEWFVIGNVIYNTGYIEYYTGDPWKKHALNESWWEDYECEPEPIEQQLWLLDISEIKILGSEKVNGVACWVVKLLPSSQFYGDYINEPEEKVKGLSVKQWFAKDTYFLMKSKVEYTLVMDEEVDIMVLREIEFIHYNEPVSIDLPAEAEAAEWAE